jgi:hypothetical protein
MGRTHRHGPPENQSRPSADLQSLERMHAPWFFDAEVQRRLRMGDPSRRASRWRRVKISAACLVFAVCLVAAYVQFGDSLLELLPQAATPIVPHADTLATPPPVDTSKARDAMPAVATPRAEPRTATVPVRESTRVAPPDSARQDSLLPAPPSQKDSVHEGRTMDTVRHAEPQRPVLRGDSSVVQPDSLGRPKGI